MGIEYVFGGIPVADLDVAMAWYERFVGRSPDLIPKDSEAAWRLTETGWIYIVADPAHAGSALHTLLVDDLDSFLAGLVERGVVAGPEEVIGEGVRRATVLDPDGNRLNVGQVPAVSTQMPSRAQRAS